MPELTAYLAFTLFFVLTPGSATAVVIRNVLAGGRRQGIAAAAGAALGTATYATASAIGVLAIVARAPLAFFVVRAGGAAFLAFLGLRSLALAFRRDLPPLPGGDGARVSRSPGQIRAGFIQGLGVNLANPAVATFYIAAVPSFVAGAPDVRARFVLFAAIHVTMAFFFHTAWAWAFDSMRALWARPAARRILGALTGLALIALAGKTAGVL